MEVYIVLSVGLVLLCVIIITYLYGLYHYSIHSVYFWGLTGSIEVPFMEVFILISVLLLVMYVFLTVYIYMLYRNHEQPVYFWRTESIEVF